MNKLSPVIQSINPVQQSSSQSSRVIRYDQQAATIGELLRSIQSKYLQKFLIYTKPSSIYAGPAEKPMKVYKSMH